MQGAPPDSINRGKGCLWLVILSLAGLCLLPVLSCLRMPDPQTTAERFQIGSKITELDRQLGDWQPDDVKISVLEGKGSSDQAHPTKIGPVQTDFTGAISLYHHSWVIPDDLKPSFVIELTYVDGSITGVEYGFLPG